MGNKTQKLQQYDQFNRKMQLKEKEVLMKKKELNEEMHQISIGKVQE